MTKELALQLLESKDVYLTSEGRRELLNIINLNALNQEANKKVEATNV